MVSVDARRVHISGVKNVEYQVFFFLHLLACIHRYINAMGMIYPLLKQFRNNFELFQAIAVMAGFWPLTPHPTLLPGGQGSVAPM